MTKVVTTNDDGTISCAAEICTLIKNCNTIPHNKSLVVNTITNKLILSDTVGGEVSADITNLINVAQTPVTNVSLTTNGVLLNLKDSAGNEISCNLISAVQASLPSLNFSFLSVCN